MMGLAADERRRRLTTEDDLLGRERCTAMLTDGSGKRWQCEKSRSIHALHEVTSDGGNILWAGAHAETALKVRCGA